MKTSILLSICLVAISFHAFGQTKTEKPTNATSAAVKSEPIRLYCLTKSKADTLIFGEKQIVFSKVFADSLINNPCLVLRPNKQFSFYYNNVSKIDSVKNSVTGLYEERMLSACEELTGIYSGNLGPKDILRLDFKNGNTRMYTIATQDDKTVLVLATDIEFMK